MLEFTIPDQARETYIDTLGFDPGLIDEVVQTPDDRQVVQFDEGATLHLFKKAFTDRRPSVVVVGMWTAPPPAFLLLVFRLYNDFGGPDIFGRMPLDLVELVARRFGGDISIGSVKSRFFLRKSFPVTAGDPKSGIGFARVHGRTYCDVTKIRLDGPPDVLTCLMLFSLDVTSYRAYLRR